MITHQVSKIIIFLKKAESGMQITPVEGLKKKITFSMSNIKKNDLNSIIKKNEESNDKSYLKAMTVKETCQSNNNSNSKSNLFNYLKSGFKNNFLKKNGNKIFNKNKNENINFNVNKLVNQMSEMLSLKSVVDYDVNRNSTSKGDLENENLNIFVFDWNMHATSGPLIMDEFHIWNNQNKRENFAKNDILIFSCQECCHSIPKSFIFNSKANWKKKLQNLFKPFSYKLIVDKSLNALSTIIFVKESIYPYIINIKTSYIRLGALNMFANKGAILVKFKYKNIQLASINVHLPHGSGNKKKRSEKISFILKKLFKYNKKSKCCISNIKDNKRDLKNSFDFIAFSGDFNFTFEMSKEEFISIVESEGLNLEEFGVLLQFDEYKQNNFNLNKKRMSEKKSHNVVVDNKENQLPVNNDHNNMHEMTLAEFINFKKPKLKNNSVINNKSNQTLKKEVKSQEHNKVISLATQKNFKKTTYNTEDLQNLNSNHQIKKISEINNFFKRNSQSIKKDNSTKKSIVIKQDQFHKEYQILEGKIQFPPTYKYFPGSSICYLCNGRLPGYPDRIFYILKKNGSVNVKQVLYKSCFEIEMSDHKPIYSLFKLKFNPNF